MGRTKGTVDYKVIRSKRKTVALQVKKDGSIVVRAPLRFPDREIQRFVAEKKSWIERSIRKIEIENQALSQIERLSEEEIQQLYIRARRELPALVSQHASKMNINYGKVTIRMQKTRWGSCSGKGNLNLNALLMLAPEKVREYVVIHELCHRKYPNHSADFWAEVHRWMPDYRIYRLWLKEHGAELMRKAGR